MANTIFGIFIILHGLVHLFYFGHSLRFFELAEEFVWPDGGWAFSWLLNVENNRKLAAILLAACTIVFAAGGIVFFFNQTWAAPLIIGAAAFSAIIFIFFWDGKWRKLPDKGAVGILINLAILAALLIFGWPAAA